MAARKRKAGSKPGAPRRTRSSPLRRGVKASRGSADSPQEAALRAVAAALERLHVPAAVIIGIAVIVHGFSRLTSDIDCAVSAPRERARDVLATFEGLGFSARMSKAAAFAEENLVLLLRHDATGIGVDVSLAQLDFEAEALASAERRHFGRVEVPVPSLTDLLIYKVLAGRPRDHQDVTELLAIGGDVNANRIEHTLTWFDELMDTDRLADWRRLWRSRP